MAARRPCSPRAAVQSAVSDRELSENAALFPRRHHDDLLAFQHRPLCAHGGLICLWGLNLSMFALEP
jgi:hypothetical protein